MIENYGQKWPIVMIANWQCYAYNYVQENNIALHFGDVVPCRWSDNIATCHVCDMSI